MSLNMEKNFNAILRRFGHNVYLQRVKNPQVENEEYDYSDKLERWTVYSMFPNRSAGAANVTDQALEGNIYNVDMVFYFQAAATPNSGDRIYEEMERYPNKQATYAVDFAVPMRGVGGKIVFWSVGASRIRPY